MMSIFIGVMISALAGIILFVLYQAYRGNKVMFTFLLASLIGITLYFLHSRENLNSAFAKGDDVICHVAPDDILVSNARGYVHEGDYFIGNAGEPIYDLECEAL